MRDFAAMEKRRFQAARLFAQGASQAEVARTLGVSEQSTGRWHRDWEAGGEEALRAAGRAGRPSRLTTEQLEQLEETLLAGPARWGYRTELWTLSRIAEVIRALFGVRYHPGYVWWILRRLGWTCQRPATRAKERDEEAVQRWLKEKWPEIERGHKRAAPR